MKGVARGYLVHIVTFADYNIISLCCLDSALGVSTLIRNSRCWELHDAVYKYAVLNTNESRDCYIQYLALTEGYLNWSSIIGWERNNEKRDRKNRIETRRSRATTRSRATS